MSDVLAVVQPEEPAGESAPAASNPAQRDHGRLPGLTAWLLVAIAAVGLLASTPPSAGPDEPVHEVTAWYLSVHVLPPGSAVSLYVPQSLWLNPCFATHSDATAACMEARSMNRGVVATRAIVDYPPPYSWVVG